MFSVILKYFYVIHTINWWTFKFQFFFLQWVSLFHPSRKNSVTLQTPKCRCIHCTQWRTRITIFSQLYRFQGDICGQSIWDKVMCYWEHVMKTHWKNLGNKKNPCALDLCFPSSICTKRKWKRVTKSNVFSSYASHVLDACDLPLLLQQKGGRGF
jgi:hypothetical protein